MADRLVEVPYRFDDREQGESKMSIREAAGYVTQLRRLYAVRWSSARPSTARLSSIDLGCGLRDRRAQSRRPRIANG